MLRFLLLLCLSTFSVNVSAFNYSDDNYFVGDIAGEKIVFHFDFEGDESTFFFESNGKDILLKGRKIGNSMELTSENDRSAYGTFSLRFDPTTTSLTGQWESLSVVKDVVAHKIDAKEWLQNIDINKMNLILEVHPEFVFRPVQLKKLNLLKIQDGYEEMGFNWKEEITSGVAFPYATSNPILNKKLEGIHYMLALNSLNTYQGSNFMSTKYNVSFPLISKDLLSIQMKVKNYSTSSVLLYDFNYLFDVKTGKRYGLQDIFNVPTTNVDFILNLVQQQPKNDVGVIGDCDWEHLIGLGAYDWFYGTFGIGVYVQMGEACYKMYAIHFDELKKLKNKSFPYSLK